MFKMTAVIPGLRSITKQIDKDKGRREIEPLHLPMAIENVKKGDRVLVRVLRVDPKKEQIRSRITRVL